MLYSCCKRETLLLLLFLVIFPSLLFHEVSASISLSLYKRYREEEGDFSFLARDVIDEFDTDALQILEVAFAQPSSKDLLPHYHFIRYGLFGGVQRPVRFHLNVNLKNWRVNNSVIVSKSPLSWFFKEIERTSPSLRFSAVHFGDQRCKQNTDWYSKTTFTLRTHYCSNSLYSDHTNLFWVPLGWLNRPPESLLLRLFNQIQSPSMQISNVSAALSVIVKEATNEADLQMPPPGRSFLYSFAGRDSMFRKKMKNMATVNNFADPMVPSSIYLFPEISRDKLSQSYLLYYANLKTSIYCPLFEFEDPSLEDNVGIDTESHRLYEAMECGCIPVIVESNFSENFSSAPFIVLKRWRKYFQDLVMDTNRNVHKAQLRLKQQEVFVWWKVYLVTMQLKIRSIVDRSMGDVDLRVVM